MPLGENANLAVLIAAALAPDSIDNVELGQSLASLHELIERNAELWDSPNMFIFGLLEHFDIVHLAAMLAPRPIKFRDASHRMRQELSALAGWYQIFGVNIDPFEP